MRILLEVHRRGQQYAGSLTRAEDDLCLPFVGVLELVAALERLAPEAAEDQQFGEHSRTEGKAG